VPWLSDPALSVTVGAADPADPCAITIAKAAIAETGTLVLVSEPTTPYLMNFLPETLVVVVPASRIVALLEDAFDLVRAGPANITRNFTLVTGPSRTADIEQTLEIGAHGPKRELIVIVHDPRQL
jgi:L-lactate dehydrogenase complex protein LldG